MIDGLLISLNSLTLILITVGGGMFVLFSIVNTVQYIKKLMASSSSSAGAFLDKKYASDWKKTLDDYNKKSNAAQTRDEERKAYEEWKEAHKKFDRYFEERFNSANYDHNGMMVLGDDDIEAAGSWSASFENEYPPVERFDREEWGVDRREDGQYLVRNVPESLGETFSTDGFAGNYSEDEEYQDFSDDSKPVYSESFTPDYEDIAYRMRMGEHWQDIAYYHHLTPSQYDSIRDSMADQEKDHVWNGGSDSSFELDYNQIRMDRYEN